MPRASDKPSYTLTAPASSGGAIESTTLVRPGSAREKKLLGKGYTVAPSPEPSPERVSRVDIPGTSVPANSRFNFPEAPKAQTEEEIFSQRLKMSQGLLDSINARFDAVVRQEQDAGEIRGQRTRALNISAGLGGSDFAGAAAEKTEAETREIIAFRNQERAARISEVLSGIRSRAAAAAARQAELAFSRAESRFEAENEFFDEQRERGLSAIQSLGEDGVSAKRLRENDPESYDNLLQMLAGRGGVTDLTRLEADSLIDDAKRKGEQIDYDIEQIIEGKNGNAVLLRVGTDRDGERVKDTYDLGIDYGQVADRDTIVNKGVVYERQADGSFKPILGTADIDPGDVVSVPEIAGLSPNQARDVFTKSQPPDWFRQRAAEEGVIAPGVSTDKAVRDLWNEYTSIQTSQTEETDLGGGLGTFRKNAIALKNRFGYSREALLDAMKEEVDRKLISTEKDIINDLF